MSETNNTFQRALRYLFMNIAFIWKGIHSNADLLFVQSTPPTQGAMAAIIKKIKKIRFIYNLQDIFPDSLVSAGMASQKSLLWKVGRKIEDFTYKNADKIIVISENFKTNIINKGVPAEKIDVIYNWVNEDIIRPISKIDNELFDTLNLDRQKFNIVYAGNLGAAQNIEIILDAAKSLSEFKDVFFVIIGNGTMEEHYKELAKKMQLTNIAFFPMQPVDKISEVYSLGDCSVVSCKPGFGKSAMPSKTWSIMATATPIIASFDKDTELENIIVENNIGIFTEANNNTAFCEAILHLYKNKDLCVNMGQNGRDFIIQNVSKKKCIDKYKEVYNELGK